MREGLGRMTSTVKSLLKNLMSHSHRHHPHLHHNHLLHQGSHLSLLALLHKEGLVETREGRDQGTGEINGEGNYDIYAKSLAYGLLVYLFYSVLKFDV